MNCRQCQNRVWGKTQEEELTKIKICSYCEDRRRDGKSCMGGHGVEMGINANNKGNVGSVAK